MNLIVGELKRELNATFVDTRHLYFPVNII